MKIVLDNGAILPDVERKGTPLSNAIVRLATYEDTMPLERAQELAQAEKDGRLVVLPVSPYLKPMEDNEMFILEDGEVRETFVAGVQIGPNGDGIVVALYETVYGDDFYGYDIGKTVFLTREEAEAALKKGR